MALIDAVDNLSHSVICMPRTTYSVRKQSQRCKKLRFLPATASSVLLPFAVAQSSSLASWCYPGHVRSIRSPFSRRCVPGPGDLKYFPPRKKWRQHPMKGKADNREDSALDGRHKAEEMVGLGLDGTMEPLMVFSLSDNMNDSSEPRTMTMKTAAEWKPKTTETELQEKNLPADEVVGSSPLGISGLDLPVTLAPASGISYFYLHKTLGLPEDAMWKITLEAGTVLGFTVQNLEQKVSLLRRIMNLSDEDVRTIITKQPTILNLSADKNLAPKILFLVRQLDLSKSELRTVVVQYPCILCYSKKNLQSKIDFFLDTMEFSRDETRKLIVDEPKLMCAAVESGLCPRMEFLHKEIEIPLDMLRSIVLRNPKVLMYSVEKNLREKIISFFIMRLRMEPKHLHKLLSSYPAILNYNLHDHMYPIAQYFTSDLEFSLMELRSILLKFPRLMTYSLLKIKHLIGCLRFELGLNAAQVKRVVFQAPQVIGLDTDVTVKNKIKFLYDTFDLTDEDLRKVVVGMPTLLICGIESNLKPKAVFLLKEFGGDLSLLRDVVVTQPTLLGYSLEKRIKPRLERIRRIGAHPRRITVGITLTEANFEAWLANKQAKIKANGGVEPLRKRRTVKEKQVDAVAVETDERKVPNDVERRTARIVHWKR